MQQHVQFEGRERQLGGHTGKPCGEGEDGLETMSGEDSAQAMSVLWM
jgi:hypothetical protein